MTAPLRPQSSPPALALLGLTTLVTGCEVAPKSSVAPSTSLVTFSAAQPYVPVNGSTTLTLELRNSGGNAVPDDTAVVVQAERGRITPQKARTQNGRAVLTYRAGEAPGSDRVRAHSGDMRAELEIAVGSAAIERLVVTPTPAVLPPGGGRSDIVVTVLGAGEKPVAGAPVRLAATAGQLSSAGPIVSDAGGVVRASLQTTSTATVTARIFEMQRADASVRVRAPSALQIAVSVAEARVGEPVTFTIRARNPDGDTPTGALRVEFGDGRSADVTEFRGQTEATHTYAAAGSFDVTARLLETDGAQAGATIRLEVKVPPPPPGPTPTPGPSPSADELDLNRVTWLHGDVSGWSRTSTITSVRIGGSLCIDHTKSGQWPVTLIEETAVEGNPWVFANVGGRWYAATYEWLRPGQVCKGIDADNIGPHTSIGGNSTGNPLHSWRPRSGETVGFMVTTRARDGRFTSNERTQVVLVVWP